MVFVCPTFRGLKSSRRRDRTYLWRLKIDFILSTFFLEWSSTLSLHRLLLTSIWNMYVDKFGFFFEQAIKVFVDLFVVLFWTVEYKIVEEKEENIMNRMSGTLLFTSFVTFTICIRYFVGCLLCLQFGICCLQFGVCSL